MSGCYSFQSFDVIAMFVGDEYCFNFFSVQPQSLHSFVYLPAGQPCIHKNGFILIANIITIATTPRIQRRYKKRHFAKIKQSRGLWSGVEF